MLISILRKIAARFFMAFVFFMTCSLNSNCIFAQDNKVLNVPGDFEKIQQAIDASEDGAVIIVGPGEYRENIDFKGKVVNVKSLKGPEKTVIDGDKKGSVVVFKSGESRETVLEGFTVRNGSGTVLMSENKKGAHSNGGGIFCWGSSPTIRNNIIEKNIGNNGGGICCLEKSSPLIEGNIIRENKATKGGGVRCSIQSSPDIKNNRIHNNEVDRLGGGIYWRVRSYPYIENNIIVDNIAGERGGGLFGSSKVKEKLENERDIIVTKCEIRRNSAPYGKTIFFLESPSKVKISYCNIEDEGKNVYDTANVIIWEEGNYNKENKQ